MLNRPMAPMFPMAQAGMGGQNHLSGPVHAMGSNPQMVHPEMQQQQLSAMSTNPMMPGPMNRGGMSPNAALASLMMGK